MFLDLSLQSNLKDTLKQLSDIQKEQLPFATALALTRVGQRVKEAERNEIKRVFDRPTNFTLNSLFLDRATKRHLQARVWLRDWAPKGTAADVYLAPQIYGVKRNLKGFEVLLKARGILPKGYFTVPGRSAKLDRFGNISKGLLNQILSYSGAQRDNYQNTKQGKKRQTKAKFILLDTKRGKPGGIWAIAPDNRIYPVLIFIRQPNYKKRWEFFKVAERIFNQYISNEFDDAMRYAIETRKKV